MSPAATLLVALTHWGNWKTVKGKSIVALWLVSLEAAVDFFLLEDKLQRWTGCQHVVEIAKKWLLVKRSSL